MLPREATFAIHPHQGKRDLMEHLRSKLRAYSKWIPPEWRIVVLLDRDSDDCHKLKAVLENEARTVGLVTKSARRLHRPFQVLNRIAIEELEAWFFGDVPALCDAYHGVPATLGARAPYRDPDGIKGGTWERLEQVLQRAGYYKAGLPKTEAARAIARCMNPARNRSHSFNVFKSGLESLSAV